MVIRKEDFNIGMKIWCIGGTPLAVLGTYVYLKINGAPYIPLFQPYGKKTINQFTLSRWELYLLCLIWLSIIVFFLLSYIVLQSNLHAS